MEEFTLILNLDVVELLEDLRQYWKDNPEYKFNPNGLSKISNKSDDVMFCCPFHVENHPSCGMKKSYPFAWNCFSCGASGNLEQFIMSILGLSSEIQAIQFLLQRYVAVSVKERIRLDIESILDKKDIKPSVSEDEVRKYTSKRHIYMFKRGFSERTLSKYEIGYDEILNAITFPVRTSMGEVRFIKRRFIDSKKFLNESGVCKKDIVYGLYYLLQAQTKFTEIYLTESETDTMACYQSGLPAGAILGRILFKEQIKELLLAGIKTVNLFFDNDHAGFDATLKAFSLMSQMSPLRVNVVIYPGGHIGIDKENTFKDANELLLAKKIKDIKLVPFEEFLICVKH